MNRQVGQLPYQTFPGPYGPPVYGYPPQPCHWDPNATRFGGAWVCDGYAHVGQSEYGLLQAQLATAAAGVVLPPQSHVGFWLDYVPIDFVHTTLAVSEAGLTGPFGCYPQQYWNGTKCVDNPVCPPGQHVQAGGSGKPSPYGGVYVDYFCQPDCPPYSYWNAQMDKCVSSAPGSPGGPPLQPCPPGKHYDPYLETCVGGPKVAGKPQVGQTTTRHTGTVKQPDQRWPNYPWWGYQYGWPWYGQQASCYFDPWAGVWVCPASPWVYQPITTRWYFTSPWRRHPSLMLG